MLKTTRQITLTGTQQSTSKWWSTSMLLLFLVELEEEKLINTYKIRSCTRQIKLKSEKM